MKRSIAFILIVLGFINIVFAIYLCFKYDPEIATCDALLSLLLFKLAGILI